MHKILVIRLYFPLDALHVSDSVSPPLGATFYKLYIAFGICQYHTSGCCVAIATQQRHVWYQQEFLHLVGLYTYCKMMHCAYNVKLEY